MIVLALRNYMILALYQNNEAAFLAAIKQPNQMHKVLKSSNYWHRCYYDTLVFYSVLTKRKGSSR